MKEVFCNKCKYYDDYSKFDVCIHPSNIEISIAHVYLNRKNYISYKVLPQHLNKDNNCPNFEKRSFMDNMIRIFK
jgi:hypothetical protein